MQKSIQSFDNTRICYEYVKGRSKQTIIFLHGLGGDITAWQKEILFFNKKNFSTLAVDLRGHGLSERKSSQKDYSIKNFAKDLYCIIKKEKIKKPIIVGHCFGGVVTLEIQKRFPNLSKALVLISTTYKNMRFLKLLKLPLFKFLVYTASLMGNKKKLYRCAKLNDCSGWDFSPRRIIRDIRRTSFKSYILTLQNMSFINYDRDLKFIKKPTLIIVGEKDLIFNKEISRQIQAHIKRSELDIMKKDNHLVIVNDYNEINKVIWNYLEKNHLR